MAAKKNKGSRYAQIIEKIFFDRYSKGDTAIPFEREDLERASEALGIKLPKNLGDVLYSMRFRTPMPNSVAETQPGGLNWLISLDGRGKYEFRLRKISRILPNPNLVAIKVPDSTPEIISAYALDDEQALLAKVRYNRLIDIFLGITTYSLQNHLRTTVKGIGQIEIDELYVGLDTHGCHYTIPVQAKGGNDQIGIVQTEQDIGWCLQQHPQLRCRPISAQFMDNDVIAMFELTVDDDELKVVEERHYRLTPSADLDIKELSKYR